jgi:hypothetical protein
LKENTSAGVEGASTTISVVRLFAMAAPVGMTLSANLGRWRLQEPDPTPSQPSEKPPAPHGVYGVAQTTWVVDGATLSCLTISTTISSVVVPKGLPCIPGETT